MYLTATKDELIKVILFFKDSENKSELIKLSKDELRDKLDTIHQELYGRTFFNSRDYE